MGFRAVTPLLLAVVFAVPAGQAATLASASGAVLVNTGAAFVPASPGMELSADDRLMAMAGSSATLDYSGACVVTVPENQIVRVGGSEMCAAQINFQTVTPGGGAGGGAAGGGAASTLVPAVVMSAVVVGGITATLNEGDGSDGNQQPISR